MRKGVMIVCLVTLLIVLTSCCAFSWVRSRMFDASTPSGPQWPLLEKPTWSLEKDGGFEEIRSGELNGPIADKRFSWRVLIPDRTDIRGKMKVRIDNIDNTKDTSVLWSLCIAEPPGTNYSYKTPAVYIRIGAGSVKFSYNNIDTGGYVRGWYLSEGNRTSGGQIVYGTNYGIPMPHGAWHTIRLTAYTDGTWKMWINDGDPATHAADMTGTLKSSSPGNYVQWGAVDGTNPSASFYTEYCYWGQGTGEIDPAPNPALGEKYDIGGVNSTVAGDTALVTWHTERATTINKVYYGKTFHTLDQAADAVWVNDHWEATLTNLDYSQTYTFYCESTDSTGQEYDTGLHTFKTPYQISNQVKNPGFESGVDIYPWEDVYVPAPGADDTQQWGRIYSDIDFLQLGVVLPATEQSRAFSGIRTGGTPFRKFATARQKIQVTPGKWYKATVKFQGWGNIPYSPADMIGKIGLDSNGHDIPGTVFGETFTSDSDVWWGQADSGKRGEYKTATVYAKATSDVMSLFLQADYSLANSCTRIAFDDVTFEEFPLTPPATCADAKNAVSADVPVELKGVVVTARIVPLGSASVIGYVEDPSRASGIRVTTTDSNWDASLEIGSEVDVLGLLHLNSDNELEVLAKSITAAASPTGAGVKPVALNALTLGGINHGLQTGVEEGVGLNNIGLLTTVCGIVTGIGAPDVHIAYAVYVDDGSGLTAGEDGSTNTFPGIEVRVPFDSMLDISSFVPGRTYVSFRGVSSTKLWDPDQNSSTANSVQKRVVRIRQFDDATFIIP